MKLYGRQFTRNKMALLNVDCLMYSTLFSNQHADSHMHIDYINYTQVNVVNVGIGISVWIGELGTVYQLIYIKQRHFIHCRLPTLQFHTKCAEKH